MGKNRLVVAAALAAAASSAGAIEVKLSGQVNRGIMHVDDGVQSDVFHVDNDNSSTRFRFTGTGQMTPGIKAGVAFEVEYQSSPSNVVNFADRDGVSPTLDERIMEAFFQGGLGTLYLGQGNGAANGGVEVDLSGTSVAHYADVPATGGGFAFRTAAGAMGPTLGAVLSQQDFESRYDRVRYDTPSFGGFSLAASHGTKDDTRDVQELGLWYAGELGALGKLAGALGYSSQEAATPGGVEDEVTGGSVSFLHASGLNLTLGYTQREITATREAEFTYAKLGYKFGSHAVSVDYAMGDDQAALGDEGSSTSLAYVWTPINWAEIFGLIKRASLERPGTSFEDITIFMAGTRLKF